MWGNFLTDMRDKFFIVQYIYKNWRRWIENVHTQRKIFQFLKQTIEKKKYRLALNINSELKYKGMFMDDDVYNQAIITL